MSAGLSLESLMAVARSAASLASVGKAQQADQPPMTQAEQQPCNLDAAASKNHTAGSTWNDFNAVPNTNPGVAQPAGAAANNDLYSDEQPAEAAATETPAAKSTSTFKTNQDVINHCYKQGGNTWEGASKVARDLGANLNALVRDRNGTPTISSPGTGPTTPASPEAKPEGATPSTPTTPTTEARTAGTARSIKGFREVDAAKLAEQLPPQAKHLAQAFIDSGRRHNVDPLALAAISKHETGNFTSSAFRNKNNAMGVSDARGPIQQPSHEASIDKMAKLLGSTTSGPYKNASTIAQIGAIYAPIGAGNDPTGLNNHWTRGVAKFADELERRVSSSAPSV
jgi:hypothetical protein